MVELQEEVRVSLSYMLAHRVPNDVAYHIVRDAYNVNALTRDDVAYPVECGILR